MRSGWVNSAIFSTQRIRCLFVVGGAAMAVSVMTVFIGGVKSLLCKSSPPQGACQPRSGPASFRQFTVRFSPRSIRMTKWAKTKKTKMVGAVVLSLAAVGGTLALAQGDPPRAFDATTAAVRAPGTTVRIDLIGDSTQTNNAGYGRGFCANVTAQVDCVNMAKGGASTKTFREQGLWERSLQTKPDYMLIQFRHNDLESKNHLPRQTPLPNHETNLRRYLIKHRAAI